jgi:hypothetical protein
MTNTLVRRLAGACTAVLAALVVAGSAGAQPQFLMNGQWYQNRGPLVDIPIKGGPIAVPNCMSLTNFPFASTGPPAFPSAPAGCIGNPVVAGAPALGFIPAVPALGGVPNTLMAAVTAMGMSPATITVPPSVFAEAPPPTALGLMIIAPTLVQLGSTATFMAPGPARATMQPVGMTSPLGGGATVFTVVPPAMGTRVLRKSDWTDQTGRAGPMFTWCPGTPGTPPMVGLPVPPVAPACLAPASGLWPGLVRYTPGPNVFGGTMTMLLSSAFTVSVVGPGGVLVHQPVGGMGDQHPGRGYSTTDTDYLMAGPVLAMFMTGPPCTMAFPFPQAPPGCGVITTSMTTVGMGAPDRNRNWGFPWTTGMVTAQNTGTIAGMMQTTTLVGTGTDMRTPLGSGMITLVAGGFSHRFGAVTMVPQDFSPLDIVTMTLQPFKTPAFSPAGMAAGVALMLLAVGFAARRRF